MQKRSMKYGLLAAIFALAVAVFGAAGIAKATAPADTAAQVTAINGILDDGIEDCKEAIAKAPEGRNNYATLTRTASASASNGYNYAVTTTILQPSLTIAEMKNGIIDVLTGAIVEQGSADVVSSISIYKQLGISTTYTPGSTADKGYINVAEAKNNDSTKSEVIAFAKACLGNMYQGDSSKISMDDLVNKSFTVLIKGTTPQSGSAAEVYCTMTFAYPQSGGGDSGTQQPTETAPTPEQVTGDVEKDTQTTTTIQDQLKEENIGTMEAAPKPVTNTELGAEVLTWTVDVTNNDVSIDKVNSAVMTNVLNSISGVISQSKAALSASWATSVDNPTGVTPLNMLDAKSEDINAFGLACLNAAKADTPAEATALAVTDSGDLVNKTATIKVANTAKSNSAVTNSYYAITFTGTPTQEPGGEDTPGTPETVAVYRFYNTYDHTHLYTTDLREVARLNATEGWKQDGKDGGIYWYAPKTKTAGCVTILRFYNPYSYDHYYCPETNTAEIAQLKKDGWIPDSAASNIYSAPKDAGIPVYTLFNPYADVDTHLYTPYMSEVIDSTQPKGWWEQHSTYIYAVSAPAL